MMKNTFSKIRTLAALLMAGAAFASCSSNDEGIIEPTPAQNDKQVYTLTVKASKGNAGTRALDLDGDNLVASWEAGDELCVMNSSKVKVGTLTTSTAGSTATFTGEIDTSIGVDEKLTLIYHPVELLDFGGQTGLLKGKECAEKYDIAEANVTVESIDGSGNIIIKEGTASFVSKTAMVKFTLTDGKNLLNATRLGIKVKFIFSEAESMEMNLYSIPLSDYIYKTNGDGTLYFAMPSKEVFVEGLAAISSISEDVLNTFISSAIITFTATVGDDTYKVEKTGYNFGAGKYYKNTTLTMAKETPSMLNTPLTLEATSDGTIYVSRSKDGMQYSLNGGKKTAVTSDAINVKAGDKVAFYGDGTNITCYYGTYFPSATASVKVYGNIMSLVDEENFATATTLTEDYAFKDLFYYNDKLTDASGLVLPATTLTEYCYEEMFQFCTKLTAAPEVLPATTLTLSCYESMFDGCTSLTAAPELPATTLAAGCYSEMFYGCSSLTAAPELPATTLDNCCYWEMFFECTSLTAAPELPATTLAEACYWDMFYGCISLTAAPEVLPATTLAQSCYSGMFNGCSSLTTAPELPATTLVAGCYEDMFARCSNLNAVTCLATDISAGGTLMWLYMVADEGTFTTPSTTSWSEGYDGIPNGWTRKNAAE